MLPNQHAAMSCDSVGDRYQTSLCRYRQNRQNGQSKIDIQISEDNIQLDRYCVDICTYIFRKKNGLKWFANNKQANLHVALSCDASDSCKLRPHSRTHRMDTSCPRERSRKKLYISTSAPI